MIRTLFWTSAGSLIYTYVLFPVLLIVRAGVRPRPHVVGNDTPFVSIVIAAHNEAQRIGKKLDTLRSLDYPVERLEIVLASDGSDDGTPQLATQGGVPNLIVLDLPRVGKGKALDAAVTASRGGILVFSDANSLFATDAIRRLVRAFADPGVGGVAGNQIYLKSSTAGPTVGGERAYWNLDRALKVAQSRAGNVIAATGALYGIRRELFRPIPPGVTDDFFLSLSVIDADKRLVFDPSAVAYENVAASTAGEYARKVRIMTRGLRCVAVMPRLLDPRRTGFYALQLLSHKVLMRTMAIPLIVLAVANVLLVRQGGFYRLSLAAQTTFYLLGAAGLAVPHRALADRAVLAFPAYFCLIQVASLHATWNLIVGRAYDRWVPASGSIARGSDGP